MPRESTCGKITKYALMFFGVAAAARLVGANTVTVTMGDKTHGSILDGNCGNRVEFYPAQGSESLDIARCYHVDGTFFDPCKREHGALGPNVVKSVKSLKPDEKPIIIHTVSLQQGHKFQPFSCYDGIKILKDFDVKLKKTYRLKQSDISINPDGSIANRATGEIMGQIPHNAFEKYNTKPDESSRNSRRRDL